MNRGGWNYFKFRWDRMQDSEISNNKLDIMRLQGEVMHLEQILVYLVGKLALGETLSVDDPAVADFLHLKNEDDPKRAILELVGNFSGRYEPQLITCTQCGAKVRDLPGITDEVCTWCGQQLSTES